MIPKKCESAFAGSQIIILFSAAEYAAVTVTIAAHGKAEVCKAKRSADLVYGRGGNIVIRAVILIIAAAGLDIKAVFTDIIESSIGE